MPKAPKEFAASANGDKWFLGHNEPADQHVVIHHANDASGGTETRWPISSFLEHFGDHPQGQALRAALRDAGSVEQEASSEHTRVAQKPVISFPWSRKMDRLRD
ncbi:hypothetical protein GGE45_003196 [Rhizobium aethiopicum]|uniref:Uncharacterized protein n=2 Tax=Rhizobium TaxID=379 RepID=A0A7W6Q7D5_9HYPH|nr:MULTISPECIES: hypothetical protein [Rhizobium]MBB4192120.1 hypothetical protein [Rhizobium aethiopicum]MBB4580856.1 hypothetical protein [Rhizobium aethiopicum]OWO89350.1 hypothetical protein B5E41_30570 [Rhizobium esperanzae]